MTEAVLELHDVVKRFGAFAAVDRLSFRVARGEIFGFLGPNGAGKTTTLRMILDIIQPSSGRISVLGAANAREVRHRIGYLPEERGLYRKMRAAETIAYFAQLRGVPAAAAKARAYEMLERFGLGPFARAKNESLSKGMAQKVQLLSTIAHDPELLILDEPFSGLDPVNQATLETLIGELREAGRTIMFSTHTMQHAERLCDRFLIMNMGKNQFEGTLDEARAAFPPRFMVRSSAAAGALGALAGVKSVHAVGAPKDGECDYLLELVEGADPQAALRQAFDTGLSLSRFENAGASLHDIFVAIASGDDGNVGHGDGHGAEAAA